MRGERGFLLLFGSCLVLCSASPTLGPSSSLTIANKVISPDGFKRSAVLVEGMHPGPLIKGIKGDRFRLNVINSLTDVTMQRSASIHWHGFFQKGTNWADGPTGVTQCPISPNQSFLYDFSVPEQAGTFWYHSHFAAQYCDGLRGPFIVYDPQDPHGALYDIDDESTIITLSDWYHVPSPSIQGPSLPNSTLINGKGRYPSGPKMDLAIINVVHGKRYRFRLLSIACTPNYMFSIDRHQLTIIEADGENTQPLTVDAIQIFAGQRYSFILSSNNPIGNYWIRALPNVGFNTLTNGFDSSLNSAILRYKGAPKVVPSTKQNTGKLLQESELRPLSNPAAPGFPRPGGADINLNLILGTQLTPVFHFTINGIPFESPTMPTLLQILSGARTAQDLLPHGSIFTLPPNKVVEVSIPGGLFDGPHPFHLHGHSFSVVRSAGNDTQPNYDSPMKRDVVSIGDIGSNVTIRFTTNNPGPWIFHCHIDFHKDLGLAIVFAEDPADTKFRNPVPENWKRLCPIYDALSPSETSVALVTPTST